MAIAILLFILVLFMPFFSIIFFMNLNVSTGSNVVDASSLWLFLGAYILFIVAAIGCIIWNSFSIKKGRRGKGVVGLVFSIIVLVISLTEFAIFGGLLLPHVV